MTDRDTRHDVEVPARPRVRASLALPEPVEAGLIGALSVSLVYLLRDLTVGQPLYTPGVLGTLLLEGPEAAQRGIPGGAAAAAFHVIHFAVWMVLGFLASAGATAVERGTATRRLLLAGLLIALVLLLTFESWASESGLPRFHLWAGGLVGLGFMGAYLAWLHPGLATPGAEPD